MTDDADIIEAIKVTPEAIHSDFILRRIDSALDYLAMARAAYTEDNPDAVMMALELAESEALAANRRAALEYTERDKGDG